MSAAGWDWSNKRLTVFPRRSSTMQPPDDNEGFRPVMPYAAAGRRIGSSGIGLERGAVTGPVEEGRDQSVESRPDTPRLPQDLEHTSLYVDRTYQITVGGTVDLQTSQPRSLVTVVRITVAPMSADHLSSEASESGHPFRSGSWDHSEPQDKLSLFDHLRAVQFS